MTQEEKAKAYDEALERAESAIKNCGDNKGRIAMIESIFPVLYQSEDERIRKRLIDFFEDWHETMSHCWGIAVTAILAWLEKQGEKKQSWSKDDEIGFNDTLWAIQQARTIAKDENDMGNLWYAEDWLKSLKYRIGG